VTWLEFLNKFILQWFFIRLAKVVDEDGDIIFWTILKWIIPCTGWGAPYKYLGKSKRNGKVK